MVHQRGWENLQGFSQSSFLFTRLRLLANVFFLSRSALQRFLTLSLASLFILFSAVLSFLLFSSNSAWAQGKCADHLKIGRPVNPQAWAAQAYLKELAKLKAAAVRKMGYDSFRIAAVERVFRRLAEAYPGLEVRHGGGKDAKDGVVLVFHLADHRDEYWAFRNGGGPYDFYVTNWWEDLNGTMNTSYVDQGFKFDPQDFAPFYRLPFSQLVRFVPRATWELQVKGMSPSAVREEVRRWMDPTFYLVKDELDSAHDQYKILLEDSRRRFKFELVIDFKYAKTGKAQKAIITQHAIFVPTFSIFDHHYDYGQKEVSSLAELNLWLGEYLGRLAQRGNLHQNWPWRKKGMPWPIIKVDDLFTAYHEEVQEGKAAAAYLRPDRVLEIVPLGKKIYQRPLKPWAEFENAASETYDNAEKYGIWLNSIYRWLASETFPYLSKLVFYDKREKVQEIDVAVGLPSGDIDYRVVRKGKGKTDYLSFYGRRGFVNSGIWRLSIEQAYMDFLRSAYKNGRDAAREPYLDNYYANLPYPEYQTLAQLRLVVRSFMAREKRAALAAQRKIKGQELQKALALQDVGQEGIGFNEVEYGVHQNGEEFYRFNLVLPGAMREKTKFEESFLITFDPQKGRNQGFNIQRELYFQNPRTKKPDQVLLPILGHHNVQSFDGLFEEVRQILGDFLQTRKEIITEEEDEDQDNYF